MVASTTGLDSFHKHGAARYGIEDFAKHLRKTHKYKQEAKYDLLLRSPAYVH